MLQIKWESGLVGCPKVEEGWNNYSTLFQLYSSLIPRLNKVSFNILKIMKNLFSCILKLYNIIYIIFIPKNNFYATLKIRSCFEQFFRCSNFKIVLKF